MVQPATVKAQPDQPDQPDQPGQQPPISPLACGDYLGAWIHGDVRQRARLMMAIEDDDALKQTDKAATRLMALLDFYDGDVRPRPRNRRRVTPPTWSRFAKSRARVGYGAVDGLLTPSRSPRSGKGNSTGAGALMDTIRSETVNIQPDGSITLGDSVPASGESGPAGLPASRFAPIPAKNTSARNGRRPTDRTNARTSREFIDLPDFEARISSEEAAVAFVESVLWPDGPVCPRCYGEKVYRTKSGNPMSHRCTPCRRHFSVRLGTVMEDTNLPVEMWLKAIFYLLTFRRGVASSQMARLLGTTQASAWYLDHRIRESMRQEDLLLDEDVVQIDEAWVGPIEKWMHGADKAANNDESWADRKALIFGARGRNGNVICFPVWGRGYQALIDAVREVVAPGTMVFSDGHRAYRYLEKLGYGHEWVDHSVGEYVRDEVTTNSMESFWTLLKRGYRGVYYRMSWKHLFRYCDEYSFRINVWGNNFQHIAEVVKLMAGRKLTYAMIKADNGLPARAN